MFRKCLVCQNYDVNDPNVSFHTSYANDRVVGKKPNAEGETFVKDDLNSGWLSLPQSSFINRGRLQSERASYLFPGITDGLPVLSQRRNEASGDNCMKYPSMTNCRVPEYGFRNGFIKEGPNKYYDFNNRKDAVGPESQPKKHGKFTKNRKHKEVIQTGYPQNLYEKEGVKKKMNESPYVYKLTSEDIDSQKKSNEIRSKEVPGQSEKSNQNCRTGAIMRSQPELTDSIIQNQHKPFAELTKIKKEPPKRDHIGFSSELGSRRNGIWPNANQYYPIRRLNARTGFIENPRKNEGPLRFIIQKQNYTVERMNIQQEMVTPGRIGSFYGPRTPSVSTEKVSLNFEEACSTMKPSPPSGCVTAEPLITTVQTTATGWSQTNCTLFSENNNATFQVDGKRPFNLECVSTSSTIGTPPRQFPQAVGGDPARSPTIEEMNILYDFFATRLPLTTNLLPSEVSLNATTCDPSTAQPVPGLQPLPPKKTCRREKAWSPVELEFLRRKHPAKLSNAVLSRSKKKDSRETSNSSNPNEYGPCALSNFRLRSDHALYEKGKTHFLRKITDDVPVANRKSSSKDDDANLEDKTFFDRLNENYDAFSQWMPRIESERKEDITHTSSDDEVQSENMNRIRHKGLVRKKIYSEFLKGNEVQGEKVSEIVKKKPIKFLGEEDQLLDSQPPELEQERAKWIHSGVSEKDDNSKKPGYFLKERVPEW